MISLGINYDFDKPVTRFVRSGEPKINKNKYRSAVREVKVKLGCVRVRDSIQGFALHVPRAGRRRDPWA